MRRMFPLAEFGFVMQSVVHESKLGGRESKDHSNVNGTIGAVSAGACADYAFCRDYGDIGGGGWDIFSVGFGGMVFGALVGNGNSSCGRSVAHCPQAGIEGSGDFLVAANPSRGPGFGPTADGRFYPGLPILMDVG